MDKIIKMTEASKEERLGKLADLLEQMKDELADLVENYEAAGDERSADGLTEALDALEDAAEIIGDVMGE